MSLLYVTCKEPTCGAEVLLPDDLQVPEEQLGSILHKKNYYLCVKCGKVGAYTKEDHHYA